MERIPRRTWLLPLLAVLVNHLVYYGGGNLARNLPHYNWELPVDQAVPFLPWTVSVYLLCFLFWAAVYLYAASRERKQALRFFCADFLAKLICLLCFVFLPTTNQRPAVVGNSVWDFFMRLVYRLDDPVNLFPSIHCMVSWLCFLGVKDDSRVPFPFRAGACLTALAVCLSTLTTRQHVLADVLGGVLLAGAAWQAAAKDRVARHYERWVAPLLGES